MLGEEAGPRAGAGAGAGAGGGAGAGAFAGAAAAGGHSPAPGPCAAGVAAAGGHPPCDAAGPCADGAMRPVAATHAKLNGASSVVDAGNDRTRTFRSSPRKSIQSVPLSLGGVNSCVSAQITHPSAQE